MKRLNLKGGFTLIELLMVVAIIAIIAAIVMASLNSARGKGADAAVKTNLSSARNQGEIFYNTNTGSRDSYKLICTNGAVGGVNGVGINVLNAAKATGLASYATNAIGTLTTATCNSDDVNGSAWAAEAPTKATSGMWCVDSTGKSLQEAASSLSASNDYTCN